MDALISRRLWLCGVASLCASPSSGEARAPALTLAEAIANPARSPQNIMRDKYRHPAATLAFFGLKPTQSVIEIEPGAGYWTEILAPYLSPHGTYTVAIPPKLTSRFLAKLTSDPADYGHVIVTGLTDGAALAPAQSADLALSFRNLHDWMADGTVDAKLAMIRAALKPGGMFGIEDHRGVADRPQDPRAKSGYVREDYAAALIEKAGFRLAGRSTIGNNPRDIKDYPKGVWSLPPVLAMGAVNRQAYLAIGESDRWTMKFIKKS